MSRPKQAHVSVEVNTKEPALLLALFDLVRREAAAYGLPDIEDVAISMRVDVAGLDSKADVNGLRKRIDQLWCGFITEKLEHQQ